MQTPATSSSSANVCISWSFHALFFPNSQERSGGGFLLLTRCMWHSPIDFSYLDGQERLHSTGGTTFAHPEQCVLYPRAPFSTRSWYVFLLLDANKEGHTNVIKTTDPGAYRTTADDRNLDGSAAASASAPPVNSDAQSWRVALAIDVGPSEAEADIIIARISTSSNGKKQVRGGVQRGIRGDLVSTWRHKVLFADRAALLNVSAEQAERLVYTVPYSLSASTSHGT